MSHKRILITGSNGFVGSHLVHHLGSDAIGVDKSDLNILQATPLRDFVKRKHITHIVHLAGVALVESGQDDPYQTFKTNIQGTLNVLEVARTHSIEKVIIASTSHVYGKNKVPYYEGYTPRPSRPYETSKTCADLIAQSYADTYNLPVLIPRFVNIYGPGDVNFSRLIPKTIRAVVTNTQPTLWGSGNVKRDYLYIDDAISAYAKLLSTPIGKLTGNRIYNFGTGNVYSARKVIDTIRTLAGSSLPIRRINSHMRENEIPAQYVSARKARSQLKWEAQTPLEKGITKSISWYERSNKEKK